MAVEMFSWPSLHDRMCRTWGSNSGPLACQANSLPIELPRPECWSSKYNSVFCFQRKQISPTTQTILYDGKFNHDLLWPSSVMNSLSFPNDIHVNLQWYPCFGNIISISSCTDQTRKKALVSPFAAEHSLREIIFFAEENKNHLFRRGFSPRNFAEKLRESSRRNSAKFRYG